MKITISQENSSPISITIPDNKQPEVKSQEGIKYTVGNGVLTSDISSLIDGVSGLVFKSISDLKKSEKIKSLISKIKRAAMKSNGVIVPISQTELIKLDPKYFTKGNTWEIDGITIARFNTTNLVGIIAKHYTYKIYLIMYNTTKKQVIAKHLATIKNNNR